MKKSLINQGISFFWLVFRLNLLFALSNVVLIGAILVLILHWFTLPVYVVGIFLLVASLQGLFSTIKQREKLEKISLTRLYIKCYREEFKGSIGFAWGYVLVAALLLGSYAGLWAVPGQFVFLPLYMVLLILLYVHFVFGLLVRAYFIINVVGSWRLGFYCISKYPLRALFILGGTFVMGGLILFFHQLIILGILPVAVYLLSITSEKMLEKIAILLKVNRSEEGR